MRSAVDEAVELAVGLVVAHHLVELGDPREGRLGGRMGQLPVGCVESELKRHAHMSFGELEAMQFLGSGGIGRQEQR